MSLKDIVNVTITRATATVSQVGFGTVNILGTNKAFIPLIKFYADQTEVLADFSSTDPEAIAASDAFAQSPRVTQIAISRRETSDVTTITIDVAVDNTNYTCTINGTAFTIDSGGSATVDSIALALITAINAGSEPITAATATSPYTLTADVVGIAYSVTVDISQSMAFTTTQTIGDDLAAINEADSDWYGLVLTSRNKADVLAAADWTEGEIKLFGTASDDVDIKDTTDAADTTTIAAVFKANSYARSFIFYHALAATEFADSALLGKILPFDPGSYTAKFKTLSSITVDKLSTTQQKNILDKNANVYVTVSSNNIVCDSTVSEPEFIDTIVFVDWLTARMSERIFLLFLNTLKVPYTDSGIALIEAEIVAQLQDGQAVGGIATDPPFIVTVPLAADVSPVDKAARQLTGVSFIATLAGAIHSVTINGTVEV